jgi:hypothetical protein
VTTSRAARRAAPEWRIDHPIQEVTMKPIRIAWCLAAAAVVAGCSDNPISPEENLDAPAFQAERTDLIREFIWTWEDYIPCANDGAGEYIEWNGILRWHQIRRDTPSGVHTRTNKEIEFVGYDYDAFMGFGQTSGDVWMVDSKRSQWNARKTTKGEFETFHQNYKFFLVNDMGEKLVVQGSRNWVYDKDGNLVMENLNTGKCPQIW